MSGFPYDYIIDMGGNTYKRVDVNDVVFKDNEVGAKIRVPWQTRPITIHGGHAEHPSSPVVESDLFPYGYLVSDDGDQYEPIVPVFPATGADEATKIKGAWFVYTIDVGINPLSLFDEEIKALRFAVSLGYAANVVFWPYGMTWNELVTRIFNARIANGMTPPPVPDR